MSFRTLLFAASAAALLSSCSKTGDFGSSLLENTDNLPKWDTAIAVKMTTLPFTNGTHNSGPRMQSIRTTRAYIGAIDDNVFGKTSSELHMNFRPQGGSLFYQFNQAVTCDSLILAIPFDRSVHFGSTYMSQTWTVSLDSNKLVNTNVYYSDTTLRPGTIRTLNSGHTFMPNYLRRMPVHDTTGRDTTYVASVRIPLDVNFGNTMLHGNMVNGVLDTTMYDNTDNFQTFIKGLTVKPSVNSCSALMAMLPSSALLQLYYTTSDGKKHRYDFVTGYGCTYYTLVDHDYSNTQVLANNPTDSVAYLQGVAGSIIKVDLSDASKFSKVLINRADLEVRLNCCFDDQFRPTPYRIGALYKDANGNLTAIEDAAGTLPSYDIIGGSQNYVAGTNRTFDFIYKVNMSRHFQRIIDNKTSEKAIYLIIFNGYKETDKTFLNMETAAAAVVGNERNFHARPRVIVTYTKLPR